MTEQVRKVTLRGDGKPVRAWAARFPDGRQGVQDPDRSIIIVQANGMLHSGQSQFDIVAEGWPLELVDGLWYQTASAGEVFFTAHPKFFKFTEYGVGCLYGPHGWATSAADGKCTIGPSGRWDITHELDGPPDWAKEGA